MNGRNSLENVNVVMRVHFDIFGTRFVDLDVALLSENKYYSVKIRFIQVLNWKIKK